MYILYKCISKYDFVKAEKIWIAVLFLQESEGHQKVLFKPLIGILQKVNTEWFHFFWRSQLDNTFRPIRDNGHEYILCSKWVEGFPPMSWMSQSIVSLCTNISRLLSWHGEGNTEPWYPDLGRRKLCATSERKNCSPWRRRMRCPGWHSSKPIGSHTGSTGT